MSGPKSAVLRIVLALISAAICGLAAGLVDDSGWLAAMTAVVVFVGALVLPRRLGGSAAGHPTTGLVVATIVAALLAVGGWGIVMAGFAGCSEPGPQNACEILNDDVIGPIVLLVATAAPFVVVGGGVVAVRRETAAPLIKATAVAMGFFVALFAVGRL